MVVGQDAAVGQPHPALGAVDGLGAGAEQELDALCRKERLALERQAGIRTALEELLGERRPLIGQVRLPADHGHGARMAVLAQRRGQLDGGMTAADDDDVLRRAVNRAS